MSNLWERLTLSAREDELIMFSVNAISHVDCHLPEDLRRNVRTHAMDARVT